MTHAPHLDVEHSPLCVRDPVEYRPPDGSVSWEGEVAVRDGSRAEAVVVDCPECLRDLARSYPQYANRLFVVDRIDARGVLRP